MWVIKPGILIILALIFYLFLNPKRISQSVKGLGKSVKTFREEFTKKSDKEEP